MGKRREGREAAVQYLYQRDLHFQNRGGVKSSGAAEPESRDDFWELRPAQKKTREFGNALVNGVIAQQPAIDEQIKKYSANYDLHRIAAVDRNVLRVAIYEMLFCPETPPVVSINEAIEIAKRFGSEDSGHFVNGILDRIRRELPRSAREPLKSV